MVRIILLQINIIKAYLKSFFDQNNLFIYIKILQKYKNRQKRLIYKIFKNLYDLK